MNATHIMTESTIESLDLAKEFVKSGELAFAVDHVNRARDGILTLMALPPANPVGRCCRAAQISADQQVRPTIEV